MLSLYPACFFKEKNGYSVVFPDLNYLATDGKTEAEAMNMAVDCLAGYLYSSQRDGDAIPAPSKHADISLENVAKELGLEICLDDAYVNTVSVDVKEYAKIHFEKSVKKSVTIPLWLDKTATEKKINFSKVLQEALISKLKA